MSISNYNWQTRAEIREAEYRAGYEHERPEAVDSLTGYRHEEEKQYDGTEGTTAASTFYGGYQADGYNPDESLADPRFDTRRDKFERLWQLNSGLDAHRANGRSPKDVGKPNRDTEYRQKAVHAVANGLDLHPAAVEEARRIAGRVKANRMNYYGGYDAYLLAICGYVARRDVAEEDSFQEIAEERGVAERIGQAIDKIAEIEGN